MTELQWLIKMLTQEKLSAKLKDLFIERIGEVEAKLNQPTTRIPQSNPMAMPIQAPSTQKLLAEIANEPHPTIIPTPPPAKIDKETGRAMVATGKGTFGPRKF